MQTGLSVHTRLPGYAPEYRRRKARCRAGLLLYAQDIPRDIHEFSTSYPQNVENICSLRKEAVFRHFPRVLHIKCGKPEKAREG